MVRANNMNHQKWDSFLYNIIHIWVFHTGGTSHPALVQVFDQWIMTNMTKIVFGMEQLSSLPNSPGLKRRAGASPALQRKSQRICWITRGVHEGHAHVLLPSMRGPSWFIAPSVPRVLMWWKELWNEGFQTGSREMLLVDNMIWQNDYIVLQCHNVT